MIEFFKNLFENDFMPHGHCYFWDPAILWSHAISDAIIAIAYCAIPVLLVYIFKKRNDFKFIWMMVLFAVFIFGCGLTHVFDVINIWEPYYRIDSVIRVITAIASIGTAIVLYKITPEIVKIPSVEEWKKVNQELQEQIQQLKEKDKIIEAIRQFEHLAEVVPQIMWTTDKNGQIQYMNNKWKEYTGKTFNQENPDFLDNLEPVVHPEDFPKLKRNFNNLLGSGNKFQMSYRILGKEGEYKWFLNRIVPMIDNNGLIKHFGTLTEIDEQIQQNEELKKANDELLKINNDLDNFIYIASHDLKSPISNMEGILDHLTENTKENEAIESLVIMLNKSVARLKTTIEDISEVSKIQKSQAQDVQSIYFEKVFNEVKNDLNDLIQDQSAIIHTDFSEPSVRYSKRNIRSIIYNVLSNALKYRNPNRNLQIEVKTYKEDKNIILSVTDNGLGIKKENTGKIFGMFKRLHTHIEGSGIGLNIVKRILDNNNDEIQVDSEEGKGSEFKIIFKNQSDF